MKIYDVIKSPIVTEKSSVQKDTLNTYVFKVDLKADKPLIKQSIEELYKVKVASVRTSIVPGRFKRFGKTQGRVKRWKKAIVTLREGQIQIFEGV